MGMKRTHTHTVSVVESADGLDHENPISCCLDEIERTVVLSPEVGRARALATDYSRISSREIDDASIISQNAHLALLPWKSAGERRKISTRWFGWREITFVGKGILKGK